MKAVVTEECISCGLCAEICPEVFEMGESIAVVKANPVPAGSEDSCRDAAEQCPTDAIEIQE
jgi:ferredoxin